MKMNKFLAIAMAAAVGLTACSKDGATPGNNDETQSLTILIGQPTDPGTKSIDDPLGDTSDDDQQLVTFSDGHLFLCDAGGTIQHLFTFSSAATAGTNIQISEATTGNGSTLTNIKGSVTQVFIVGNSSSITGTALTAYTAAAVVNGNISAVKAVTLTLPMQYNSTNKDLSAATLWGESNTLITDPLGGNTDPKKKYVAIELWPQVARLEIADIKAIPTTGNPVITITKYNVEGIYINNHYPTMTFGGTAGTLVNPGQGGVSVYNHAVAPYSTLGNGILHDYSAAHFGNAVTATVKYPDFTDQTKVWAYNLFASKTAATTVAPHIIVALNGVEADNGETYPEMRFITANKLYKWDGAIQGTEITHFQAGRIYQIDSGDFEFTLKNTHTVGEVEDMQLRVKVSLIGWKTERMKPGLQ